MAMQLNACRIFILFFVCGAAGAGTEWASDTAVHVHDEIGHAHVHGEIGHAHVCGTAGAWASDTAVHVHDEIGHAHDHDRCASDDVFTKRRLMIELGEREIKLTKERWEMSLRMVTVNGAVSDENHKLLLEVARAAIRGHLIVERASAGLA